ncbi:MAG: type IV pilus secretin PilQ [Geopsychrobacter sp.]|nr:type IV pilus secretin PilQ [Geopsychrobacter sp.]
MKLLRRLIWTLLLLFFAVPGAFAGSTSNSLKEVTAKMVDGQAVVHIVSAQPVGYRYTVYDSIDPVRVVVDFPRMTLGKLPTTIKVGSGGIQEIRLSTFDLSLGSLVRVEVLLDSSSDYKVGFTDNDMQLSFAARLVDKTAATKAAATKAAATKAAATKAAATKAAATKAAATKAAATKAAATKAAATKAAATKAAATKAAATKAAATKATVKSFASITKEENRVEIFASAGIKRLRYFTLDNPKRLVVDLYGVVLAQNERAFDLSKGFSKLRVGPYAEKLRFVFDSSEQELPQFTVNQSGDRVQVAWAPVAKKSSTLVVKAVDPSSPAEVSSIAFTAKEGVSLYRIDINGKFEIDPAVKNGRIVKFGIKNTTISRSLRRVYTALAFPTAVQSVTPYLIDKGDSSDIRFVVQLKGDVDYELITDAKGVGFRVVDGHFAEAEPVDGEIVPVPVSAPVSVSHAETETTPAVTKSQADASAVTVVTHPEDNSEPVALEAKTSVESALAAKVVKPEASQSAQTLVKNEQFKGEKISLIFDNISVRNVLQLIAEVSDLNIIASDQIKGDVTLRLTDVPWDQALNLILDITNLGMIQEGNVVRVLPKSTIRSMKEAELTAVRSQERLEPTVTEVMTVSYANLKAVSAPARDLLSGRGTITEDARNKLLIVNDVVARLDKVRELVKILDTPERQVMIEARIVEVNSNYSRDLGVNWGLDFNNPGNKLGAGKLGIGGDFSIGLPVGAGSAATEAGLGTGFTFGRIGIDQTVLDLRISALESNGNAKIVSTPRITTLNGEEATISQGTTIPYQTSGADGPKTEFIAAELKLTVKPVINPDDSVILEILATNDSPSITAGASAPSIDTKKAKTKVLVQDGETTVIGGIFINNKTENETGVPFLMDIPIFGRLFKSTKVTNTKAELMIFITPRILHNN